MKRQRWLMCATLGLAVWAVVGLGTSQAGVISPVGPAPATFTASVFDPVTGNDITDVWLPEWRPTGGTVASGGTPVYVVFHDLDGNVLVPASADIALVTNPSPSPPTGSTNPAFSPLATSGYPGQCTNFGSPSDLSPDFSLVTNGVQFTTPTAAVKTGFLLTPLDCGGMAVISATTTAGSHTFILPQMTGTSGIPAIWAAAFCTSSNPCTTGPEDNDGGPGGLTAGDGIPAFEEYRGFIVSGVHVRTDPRQKDLFVHLVNPQCVPDPPGPLASTLSLLGGGATTYVTGDSLFSNVDTLISGTQIHRLNYATPNAPHVTTNEWVDHFHHYSVADGLRFADGTTSTAPANDRQVNQNAVFFNVSNSIMVPQKGLRIIECVDETTSPSLLGFASLGSPNGPDNAILFTKRIVNYFTNSLGAVCADPMTACLRYSTFQNGAWTTPVAISPFSLFGVAFAFYVAMEIGHTTSLTPTVEGTNRASYGYHHAPGTGSNLDQAITNKVSNKTGNTFYIPLLYNTSDLANYEVK